ncbi:hypothetical protein ACFQDN_16555 [Pseudomonas asuensis]|uniref:Tetratricopeptide repeat protein n=1 Tax=Pseudomonas asuensis TaxID=1825787 RepID=A0ABQ2GM13_9PSED|nr:hypothetical protein [Pseudomonas asuensis]GGM01883.1 hypothetical protein GCM10009425_11430 [Pseudomonas asuensis]
MSSELVGTTTVEDKLLQMARQGIKRSIMKKWIPLFATALLVGCASKSPQLTQDEQHLLIQNDLLQAKILVVSGGEDDLKLADALLNRASIYADKAKGTGEIEFYKALVMIKQGPQADDVLPLLEASAGKEYPLAYAMLYQIYSKPYLVAEVDPIRAETYKNSYSDLDVAKSGYPSFEKALTLVERLSSDKPADAAAMSH